MVFLFLYNIHRSTPDNELARVECVVHEYPPQSTTSELGAQIVNFITQSTQFSAEMVAHSGENRDTSLLYAL